jgi:glycosyltransferase involved in cell wall biosynthesis
MTVNFFQIKKVDYEKLDNKKVSIVLPTYRKDPKFELIYESLSHQTIKNFELVIADYLCESRKDYIKSLSEKYKIPTVHVKRASGNSHALNIGIANSSGDYIIVINDCSYFPYRFVEKHLLVCTNNFLSLGTRYFIYSLDFPIEKHLMAGIEIPEVQLSEIRDFLYKKSGINGYLSLNFGEHQVTSPQDFRLLGVPIPFLISDNQIIEAAPGWLYNGNSAIPTEVFLELNGFDEEYDKGFGWIDCDFGIRAYNKGYKMYINPSNWSLEIQDSSHDHIAEFLPETQKKESIDHNWSLYEGACSINKTWANPNINLREMRKEILESKQK